MLPSVAPSSRSFTDGFFYIARSSQGRLGGTVRKEIGTQLQELRMELEFENVDDAVATQFLDSYQAAGGATHPVTLPDDFWAGCGLRETLESAGGQWFIENPVAIRSVQPRVSTVALTLVKDLAQSVSTRLRPSNATGGLFGFNFGTALGTRVYITARQREFRTSDVYLTQLYEQGLEQQEYGLSDVYKVADYDTAELI